VRVCALVERRAAGHRGATLAAALDLLPALGVSAVPWYVDAGAVRLDRPALEADLYLSAAPSPLALSLATGLEALGARVLNRAGATLLARDASRSAAVLTRAGLPVPQTIAAARPEPLAPLLAAGPLLLRPHGSEDHETAIRSPDDLPAAGDEPQVLVAHRLPPAARPSRLVIIGDDVFAAEAGRAPPVLPRLADLARRCGRALGLELYAVEVAETDAEPLVLAVDPFPDFAGVPDPARRLAEYVARAGSA
jgi:ribosomal protein S6--L-glutamate ligase